MGTLDRAVHQLAHGFDDPDMLGAEAGFGTASAGIDDVDPLSRQGGESNCLTDDGATSRVERAVDLKHRPPASAAGL